MSVAFRKCRHCGAEFRGHPEPRSRDENAFCLLSDHMADAHEDLLFICPRQIESPHGRNHRAFWDSDGTCSYCGSMTPDEFFAEIEAGEEVGPTDKSYKAYIGSRHRKFYFQHFDNDQRQRFIDLINDQTMKIGYPGYFYVLPYFCQRKK